MISTALVELITKAKPSLFSFNNLAFDLHDVDQENNKWKDYCLPARPRKAAGGTSGAFEWTLSALAAAAQRSARAYG